MSSATETLGTGIVLPQGRWRVDAGRSKVSFSLKHLLLVPVRGRFNEFEGSLLVEPDGSALASGSVRADSVETGDAKRDERLRAPDFLDAQRHPLIRLHGGQGHPIARSRLKISGDLEIRGIRRDVELIARIRPSNADGAEPADRAELIIEGHLSRRAYGIESEQLLDAGISDRVEIVLEISLLRSGA